MRPIGQSKKLHDVRYDLRGPILTEAQRLEAQGHRIMKLNIGNPAPFGFEAPESILVDMIHHLPHAQGYSDSRGIFEARTRKYGSALEGSNVDPVKELVTLIKTQRSFELNSQSIQTADQALQTVSNLRRFYVNGAE